MLSIYLTVSSTKYEGTTLPLPVPRKATPWRELEIVMTLPTFLLVLKAKGKGTDVTWGYKCDVDLMTYRCFCNVCVPNWDLSLFWEAILFSGVVMGFSFPCLLCNFLIFFLSPVVTLKSLIWVRNRYLIIENCYTWNQIAALRTPRSTLRSGSMWIRQQCSDLVSKMSLSISLLLFCH